MLGVKILAHIRLMDMVSSLGTKLGTLLKHLRDPYVHCNGSLDIFCKATDSGSRGPLKAYMLKSPVT